MSYSKYNTLMDVFHGQTTSPRQHIFFKNRATKLQYKTKSYNKKHEQIQGFLKKKHIVDQMMT